MRDHDAGNAPLYFSSCLNSPPKSLSRTVASFSGFFQWLLSVRDFRRFGKKAASSYLGDAALIGYRACA